MIKQLVRHPSGIIPQEVVEKVFRRRGRLHAFPTIDPTRTALVVIDLDRGTGRDKPNVQQVAHNINILASTLRQKGGVVAWVTTPIQNAPEIFRAVFGEMTTDTYERMGQNDGDATKLWPELRAEAGDIHTTKQGHSAFFPGKTTLHQQLQEKAIESLIVVGAVTNVCCEASARDAYELQYKVTMISDALIGQSSALDQATLTTFFRCYGDVRPTEDMLHIL
ncbi:MAG TPA: isochorismatase family cysteine hydrolase [Candidatus Saccharimonadales bacterium]|nr:isochorismatase family cysteine hydrolase [Candidatus Saccharimonadales bacterium]